MIDYAMIKRVAEQTGIGTYITNQCYPTALLKFARAIEQLARAEQREADARICEKLYPTVSYKTNTIPLEERGYRSGVIECVEAIRAAGKENKIDLP